MTDQPVVFALGVILIGPALGLVLERYVLEPIAALRVSRRRVRRRGR